MEKLTVLHSLAAPILEDAIDTDVIFPARFLLILDRDGLGRYAFHERRHGKTPFVLDRPSYNTAQIIVTGHNFGTGSSREQAVWTLADLGIRCIIARSFGEIFHSNCFKNGVLPIRLNGPEMEAVIHAAEAEEYLTVDLEAQRVTLASGQAIPFEISANHKRALLSGLDEIGMILNEQIDAIAAFEANRAQIAPWIEIPADRLARLRNLKEAPHE
jgi:3-isopropylmalate dehydratase small subunit